MKARLLAVAAFAAATPWCGRAVAQSDPRPAVAVPGATYDDDGPEVRIWTNRAGAYRYGESIQVFFRTNVDAFVSIVRVDAYGRLAILFPRSPADPSNIFAGETYLVNGRGGSTFSARESSGSGYIFAVASVEPLDLTSFARGRSWRYSPASVLRYQGGPLRTIEEFADDVLFDANTAYGYDYVHYSIRPQGFANASLGCYGGIACDDWYYSDPYFLVGFGAFCSPFSFWSTFHSWCPWQSYRGHRRGSVAYRPPVQTPRVAVRRPFRSPSGWTVDTVGVHEDGSDTRRISETERRASSERARSEEARIYAEPERGFRAMRGSRAGGNASIREESRRSVLINPRVADDESSSSSSRRAVSRFDDIVLRGGSRRARTGDSDRPHAVPQGGSSARRVQRTLPSPSEPRATPQLRSEPRRAEPRSEARTERRAERRAERKPDGPGERPR